MEHSSTWLEPSITNETDRNTVWAKSLALLEQLLNVVLPEDNKNVYGKHSVTSFGVPDWRFWPAINCDLILAKEEALHQFRIMEDDGREPAVWPVSQSVAFRLNESTIRIASIASMARQDARRRPVQFFGRYMVKQWRADIKDGRIADFGSGEFFRLGNKKWLACHSKINKRIWQGCEGNDALIQLMAGDKYSDGAPVIIGYCLRLKYEWKVVFTFPRGQKLEFTATPAGVLSLLCDRNLSEGETRRAALAHWVSAHRRRVSSESWADVRKHLRGRYSCMWRGIDVQIIPESITAEKQGLP